MMLDNDLKDVLSRHAWELRNRTYRDLRLLEQRRAEIIEIEGRFAAQEWLLKLLGEQPPMQEQQHFSGHAAMAEVLRTAPQYQMRPVDLAAEINRRGFYSMCNGRPIETQQTHARDGNCPDMPRTRWSFHLSKRPADCSSPRRCRLPAACGAHRFQVPTGRPLGHAPTLSTTVSTSNR